MKAWIYAFILITISMVIVAGFASHELEYKVGQTAPEVGCGSYDEDQLQTASTYNSIERSESNLGSYQKRLNFSCLSSPNRIARKSL